MVGVESGGGSPGSEPAGEPCDRNFGKARSAGFKLVEAPAIAPVRQVGRFCRVWGPLTSSVHAISIERFRNDQAGATVVSCGGVRAGEALSSTLGEG